MVGEYLAQVKTRHPFLERAFAVSDRKPTSRLNVEKIKLKNSWRCVSLQA